MWLHRNLRSWALWPVSQLYRTLIALRAALYKMGALRSQHPGKPVIVVGNVVAGGSGKTPVVMALVRYLQSQGLRPGVISRGYGRTTTDCRAVLPHAVASEVGDEPLLIATQCQVPVYVARQRIEAARALLAQHPDTDVLVCDDGLQHLALQRDINICVFDDRGVGNGFLLPAGPLREPWPRPVDVVLHTGQRPALEGFTAHRALADHALASDGSTVPLATLKDQPVLAVAAIAKPESFFAMLRAAGLTLAETQALPDHYDFDSWLRTDTVRYRLICTEKDAVKLWKTHSDALAVPLQFSPEPAFFTAVDQLLDAALSSPDPISRRP